MGASQWVGLLIACATLIPLAVMLYAWLKTRQTESMLASAGLSLLMAGAASLMGGAALVAVGAAVIRLGGWEGDFRMAYAWLDSHLVMPVPVAAYGGLLVFSFLVILAIRSNRRKQVEQEGDSSSSSG